MPRWLSQTWGFPFFLNRWIIVASLNSWGMASFLHIMWNNSVSLSATGGSPALKISACIASDPGILSYDRSFIAFTVSETAGNSSSSGLHSTCVSLLIASSLIDNGRLRTPSNWSAHLSKIAFLSVRRLSALRSECLRTINCLKCIKELLHILSVCKGLDFISLFVQRGALHVSEPSLNCLTYVWIGSLTRYWAGITDVGLVCFVFPFKESLDFFVILTKLILAFARYWS